MPDGEDWNRDRTEVRMTKSWLGHIGLAPDPAYEGAKVLSVRQTANGEPTDYAEPRPGAGVADGRPVRTAPPQCLTRVRDAAGTRAAGTSGRRIRSPAASPPASNTRSRRRPGTGSPPSTTDAPRRLPERENQGRHRRVRQPDEHRRRRSRRRLGPSVDFPALLNYLPVVDRLSGPGSCGGRGEPGDSHPVANGGSP